MFSLIPFGIEFILDFCFDELDFWSRKDDSNLIGTIM